MSKTKTVKFNCPSCEVEGKINFITQDDTITEDDVAYCPFCAHDIQENDYNEEVEDEELEDE